MTDSEKIVDACQRYLHNASSESLFDHQTIREYISVALIDQPTLDAHTALINSAAIHRDQNPKGSLLSDDRMNHIVQNGFKDIENTELARLALSSVALIELSKRIESEISTPPSHSNLHNPWIQTLSAFTDRVLDKKQGSDNEELDQARADNMFQAMLTDKNRGR